MNFIVDNWYLIVMAIGSGAMLLVPMIKGGGMGGLSAAAAVQLAEGLQDYVVSDGAVTAGAAS